MNAELLKGLVLGMALASKQCLQKASTIDPLAFGLGNEANSLFASLTSREAVVDWLANHLVLCTPEQSPCDAILDHMMVVGKCRRASKNAKDAYVQTRATETSR